MSDDTTRSEGQNEHLSDHALLALIARGDRDAFARLYDRFGQAAYSLALRVVRDRELAADVVQDAFLVVWNQAATFDANRGQPSSWILTVTHHRAVDVVRREHRRRAIPSTRHETASIRQSRWTNRRGSSVAGEQVRAALRTLPDQQREVIELAYFAGYSQSELAERLALPIGTVKSRTFAAMKQLRDALAAAGVHPEDEWNTSTS